MVSLCLALLLAGRERHLFPRLADSATDLLPTGFSFAEERSSIRKKENKTLYWSFSALNQNIRQTGKTAYGFYILTWGYN